MTHIITSAGNIKSSCDVESQRVFDYNLLTIVSRVFITATTTDIVEPQAPTFRIELDKNNLPPYTQYEAIVRSTVDNPSTVSTKLQYYDGGWVDVSDTLSGGYGGFSYKRTGILNLPDGLYTYRVVMWSSSATNRNIFLHRASLVSTYNGLPEL